MLSDFSDPASYDRLLADLARLLNVPARQVAATRAWQDDGGSDDSLAFVELAVAVEDELSRG